uniref:Chorion class high-cysteine HCB protein 12-like n=1 Tax=Elaeophora elaphi TaxID=1147741 RepID=A0A0R3RL45_9BILA
MKITETLQKLALLLVFALAGHASACIGGGCGGQAQCCCLKLPPICLPILNVGGCCGGCCCQGQGGGFGGGYALPPVAPSGGYGVPGGGYHVG